MFLYEWRIIWFTNYTAWINRKILIINIMKLLLCWCFTALRHFSGHFGRGQLTYLHCSWASLLGSLIPVLSAHSFASNWQLPLLNQRKAENGRRNYFMTNLYERMLPDVMIQHATVRLPDGRASDRATAPGQHIRYSVSTCLCRCHNKAGFQPSIWVPVKRQLYLIRHLSYRDDERFRALKISVLNHSGTGVFSYETDSSINTNKRLVGLETESIMR